MLFAKGTWSRKLHEKRQVYLWLIRGGLLWVSEYWEKQDERKRENILRSRSLIKSLGIWEGVKEKKENEVLIMYKW